MDKVDKIKTLLNKKIERRPTFGTDPNEPWSVRAGITESNRGMLDRYLMSRGINPKFLSKYTRISHAKSSSFQQWKKDHMVEENGVDESKTLQHTPVELRQHAINREKHMTKVLTHNGLHKEESEQIDELAPSTLASYVLKTSSKDPNRAEPRKKAMSKLAKTMAKQPVDTKAPKYSTNIFGESKKPTALEKFRAAAAEREKKHAEIEKKQSKDGSGMTAAIDRLEKHLNKEAADTGVSKAKETSFHKKLDKLVHSTFGKRKDEMKMKEDVFQDTQAATQTAFDMGTQADDREPVYSKKKEMSKSARMIKALYKKNKMVKEELYDHEKEDKSVASYGKKPKVEKQEVYDDDQAAMVLSGGKTLTGQPRDTLEIDPVLRKPNKPDNKQQINKQQ